MDKLQFAKHLENRTEILIDKILVILKELPKDTVANVIVQQLVRSSGSIGANYIEANESLSRKDFFHRIRICRKEARETIFWLNRLLILVPNLKKEIETLIKETTEFVLIFSKIISKA